MKSVVGKAEASDKHVFRSQKSHGCCFCRGDIPIGSGCHTEIVFFALKSFKVRYYHVECWRIQRIKYGHRWCDECEQQAAASAENKPGLLHLRRSEAQRRERSQSGANEASESDGRKSAERSGASPQLGKVHRRSSGVGAVRRTDRPSAGV